MKHRLLRVNELLKRELSALLLRDVDFGEVLVTVNQVDVTPDLKNAHVFISILGAKGRKEVLPKLEANRATLQADLSKHVVLKYTPHLVFHLDDSIERGDRVLEILQEIEPPAAPGGFMTAATAAPSLANSTFAEIAAVLREHESFVVLSHVRPDGDALGSQIAMGLALRQLGKKVKVWNEEGLLEKFTFLPGGELVSLPPDQPEDFDVVLALDTATRQRLGDKVLAAIGQAKVWINIDHHPSNPRYGDLVHIDPIAPATGQILFELLESQDLPLDQAIAENLFAAISTDTGSFQYPNTTDRTFEIAAAILRCGIKVGELSQQLYESYPRRRIELLRVLLDRMRFDAGGKVATFSLPLATADELGVIPEDNEGLIDHLRAIEGVVVAGFFEELEGGKVRVSMRSKDERADVCAICQSFKGGGHKLAAGARVPGGLNEVAERVIAAAVAAVESL